LRKALKAERKSNDKMESDLLKQETTFQEKLYDEKAFQEKLTSFYQGAARKLDIANKKLVQENKTRKDEVQKANYEKQGVVNLFE